MFYSNYEEMYDLNGSYAVAKSKKTGKYGIVSYGGQTLAEFEYDQIERIKDSEYLLLNENGNQSLAYLQYISLEQNPVFKVLFASADDIDLTHIDDGVIVENRVDDEETEYYRIYLLSGYKIVDYFDITQKGYTSRWCWLD